MLKEKVLFLLEQNQKNIVTGGELSRKLNVSRTAVWKAVNSLKSEGYAIESLKNSGYRLTTLNDILSEQSIRNSLRTKFLGSELKLFKTISSTNQYLKEQDFTAIREGLVVLADEQTRGRGRFNRHFYSPFREGLYLSMFLKPKITISETRLLTMCAAVAVCQAIEQICGATPEIKWPNDIYYKNKKLCGILTEVTLSAENQSIEGVIIGIGINTGCINRELEDTATSLFYITGKKEFRNALAAEFLNQFEKIYLDITLYGQKEKILSAYKERQFIMNRKVTVINAGEKSRKIPALVIGIDDFGGLIVKNDSHDILHLYSEEISLEINMEDMAL